MVLFQFHFELSTPELFVMLQDRTDIRRALRFFHAPDLEFLCDVDLLLEKGIEEMDAPAASN